jgi:hypothetical protein
MNERDRVLLVISCRRIANTRADGRDLLISNMFVLAQARAGVLIRGQDMCAIKDHAKAGVGNAC